MTSATAAIHPPAVRSLATGTSQQGANVVKNAVHTRNMSFSLPTSGGRRFAVAAASRSTKQEPISNSNSNSNSNSTSDDPFTLQDDVGFLLKLGAGSFAGAAAIKYGSILVPEITRPNIVQALIMIFTPVILAVFLLIKQSGDEQ